MKNWDIYLPEVLQGIRAKVSESTGYSPFELMFGVGSHLPIDSYEGSEVNLDARKLEVIGIIGVRKSLERESVSSENIPIFKENDLVMVLRKELRKDGKVSKFKPRYLGPFKIIEKLEHNLYKVESEANQTFVFHISRIIKFFPRITLSGGESNQIGYKSN
ncbi:Transposon Ty3-G Gag-Pol polyprotein [Smittium culicis]|uniref:Transposon Ty3-G Gag-Pol polyprotein n=1 Tax=Smittium culicis TaxID=133412 RepID=A0A1R1YRF8_9FUNG|nr:Transposon Ty3-G Gag-Pol polyprotein [Smittium culicis]